MSVEQFTEENINNNEAINEQVVENAETTEAVEADNNTPKKSEKPTAQAYGTLEHLTEEQIAKRKKFAAIWDKITTGLLIALMVSPVAIIGWIFFYFIAISSGWFEF